MRSFFEITTPASDLKLLTIEEARKACGVSGNGKDSDLIALEKRVANRLARVCKVRAGGINIPTFRKETITETYYTNTGYIWNLYNLTSFHRTTRNAIVLSRKPIVSIASVIEDEVELVEDTDFKVDKSAGLVKRISTLSNSSVSLTCSSLVVIYDSGWDIVPDDLKLAAEQLIRDYYFQSMRDSAVKEIEIPGVIRRVYTTAAGSGGEPDISQDIMDMLAPYMYYPQG